MAEKPRKILACSCDDSMALDGEALRRACRGADVQTARQLCRAEAERFRAIAADGGAVTVTCTQEAPLFSELAEEAGGKAALTYVNIREHAGWSTEGAQATPKIAALLAAAAEPVPDIPYVTLQSEGVILIYGRDEQAVETARLLKDHLDVTVLITPPANRGASIEVKTGK